MKSLKFKLIFYPTIIIIIIQLLFSFYNISSQGEKLNADLAKDGETIANNLVENISVPIYNFDMEVVKNNIIASLKFKDVLAIQLKSMPSNKNLFFLMKGKEGKIKNVNDTNNNYSFNISKEIYYNKEIIGVLTIYYTNSFIQTIIDNFIQNTLISILIVSLFLIFPLLLLINFIVLKPIGETMSLLSEIPDEINLSITEDTIIGNEIIKLKKYFTAILKEIKQAYYSVKISANRFKRIFSYLQNAISNEKYDLEIPDESGNDELVLSMNKMLKSLHESNIIRIKQDWLKTGETMLANEMRAVEDLTLLAKKGISFIAKYTGAKVATIYIIDENDIDRFNLTAAYAFKLRKGLPTKFKIGEGYIGQTALEKDSLIFTDIPNDYIKIESGLGYTAPDTISLFPLLFEQKTIGVMEFGNIGRFDNTQLEFIEIAAKNIAATISSAIANKKMFNLFEKTKIQADELEIRQNELEKSNIVLENQKKLLTDKTEELKAQEEELRGTNEELIHQTNILKKSEDKLKTQQNELQQTNTELEEKTQMLEEQKEETDKKNEALKIKQREIEEKAKELEIATKYKSEFLANMSHELRTPLNSMLLLAKMLADNDENNLSKDQIESAETIHNSGQNLLRLINDILDLSKIEAHKIELNIEKVRLQSILSNQSLAFKQIADNKNLEFITEIAVDLPEIIISDSLRIEQILRNFLSNSFKFTESGTVSLKIERIDPNIKLKRKYKNPKNLIAISVSDTGIGIPDDKQNLIFEAFKQVDGSISRKFGGTGLGMSISRELSNLIGGEIILKSVYKEGTTFTLVIPEVLKPKKNETKENSNSQISQNIKIEKEIPKLSKTKSFIIDDDKDLTNALTMKKDKRTILIIEDDEQFAKTISKFAKVKNFEPIFAKNGEEGIKLAIENIPNAIILDIGLPDINGWAVLDELKNNLKTMHIPIHIMSGYDDNKNSLNKGAIGYFKKPLDKEQLDKAFSKFDSIISDEVKKILIIENNNELEKIISKIINDDSVEIINVKTEEKACDLLNSKSFNCVIIDWEISSIDKFKLLDSLSNLKKENESPIIIYTTKALTSEENTMISRYTTNIILKNDTATDRLLDETALFLHKIANKFTKKERMTLQKIHNKESVLFDKNILIVDDDMRNAFALSKFLKTKNINPLIANNGKKAIEVMNSEKVDIVLMDIMMPIMDGYETMRKIRENEKFRNIPIIALTAKAMSSDREKAIKAGANDYLTKPIDITKLMTILKIWVYRNA